ncbi:TetR/AcrR family transcriptional regulator [Microbacterium sp. ZXX196]|uniref:TetR/AcrR family transcriptional regulator n=1 Tax=Microbacterium sp. ZXX196 TaxID=2609291 RepID=UPI0018ACE74D|nr:TetR/AcrR family transcriptional regulator [Microbacterium sp. ZXX196]
MTQTSERDRLLGLVADLILRDGMIGVSLSAIARGVGSNNRMLLYYFGSKEELLTEASVTAFNRFPRLRSLFAQLATPGDLGTKLLAVWEDIAAPEHEGFLRVYFERFGVAVSEPDLWRTFIEQSSRDWLAHTTSALVARGHAPVVARNVATYLVAVWRGLQMGLLTGEARDQLAAANALAVTGAVAALAEAPQTAA